MGICSTTELHNKAPKNLKEMGMEQILKQLTLEDYFGKGKHKITPEEFFEKEDCFLLDVRSREEADTISIKMNCHANVESRNIPLNEVPDRINEIPKEKFIGIFCTTHVRSGIVFAYLLSKGFSDVRIIEGGFPALTGALKPGKILKASKNKG